MKLSKGLFAFVSGLCLALVMALPAMAADMELAKKSTINTILSRGELRVGVDIGYMPFEMVNKDGEYIGFDIDLGKELAKAMGVKYVAVNSDFDGQIPALMTGKFDVCISGMTITQDRNLRVAFSDPYVVIGQTILLNKKHEGKITSWEQLNDPQFTVVSRQGTTGEFATKRLFPKAKYRSFEKEVDGALEVANDRADAWVYDLTFNVVFMAEHGQGKVVHLDKPFTYEPIGITLLQGDPDFLNFLNNFLRQIKNDGRYDRIYNKWIASTDWFKEVQNDK